MAADGFREGVWFGEKRLNKKEKADGGGLRFDEGKNRLDLLPSEWVWALGDVTTQGSKKYPKRNWERGMPWSDVVGPMFRHAFKFLCGEIYDSETGCHHMAMVAWNALALMSYDLRGIGEDDVRGIVDMELLTRVNSGEGTNNIEKDVETNEIHGE